jgi:hypothetical protein
VRLPELTDWQEVPMYFGGNHGITAVAYGITGEKRPSKHHKQVERDAEILRQVEEGKSTAEIARVMGLSWFGANNIIKGYEREEYTPEMK